MRAEVEELFHEVADLSKATRALYFAEHRVDPTTQAELEELLAFDSNTIPSLERNISHAAERALSSIESHDMRCGPYRLDNLLGRGGMGAVYLGERVDGEVKQRVAVKILRAGPDDPQLRGRFLAERQILAGLSHPNIARLLDAGHREDGQPYLVMEFVEGKQLDVYAEHLSTRQRVALFIKVCLSVGYLHRNLVVHRDLKPSNILVTSDGEPKLLDFGIAKILDLTTDQAATQTRMLTPDYASPEQFAGRAVNTSSDIYSLGAVLYRLLTGKCPHRPDGVASDEQPTADSAHRITPPSATAPELKGDLEAIVMKALRPQPQDRYATAEQFAEDLENYLKLRPLYARRDDKLYRMQRFLRRYWVFVTAGMLVVISLAAGLYVANRERMVAERRFAQLRQLSKRVIDLDGTIRTLPGAMEARRKLVAASLEYLEGLRREAGENPELAREVGEGYWHLGRIQGVNAEMNLGDSVKAEDSLKKAATLIDSALVSHPDDGNILLQSALIAHDRMIVADTERRRGDALAHAQTAVARLDSLLSHDDSRTPLQLDGFLRLGSSAQEGRARIATLYGNIALMYVNAHLYADGIRFAQKAVDLSQPLDPAIGMGAEVQGLGVLANALRFQGDPEAALATIRRARELTEKGSYQSETARFFGLYGLLMREGLILGDANGVSLNRPDEAIAVFKQVLALTEAAAEKDPHDSSGRIRSGAVARELGSILIDRDSAGALAVFDLGIRRLTESGNSPGSQRSRAELLARSSYPLRRLGRASEARTRIDTAFAILRDTKDYPAPKITPDSQAWTVVCALADYQETSGDLRLAIGTYEQLLESVTATKQDATGDLRDAPKISRMYEDLSDLYTRIGDKTKAAAVNSRNIELWSALQHSLPKSSYVQQQLERSRLENRP